MTDEVNPNNINISIKFFINFDSCSPSQLQNTLITVNSDTKILQAMELMSGKA
jgi:hypothetical protein